MNDRGEKIINLAREMLQSDMDTLPAVREKNGLSFKIMCLATVLTAVSSSAVTYWSTEHNRSINKYEKTEINALFFYTARKKNIDEAMLRHEVENKFGITDVDDMSVSEFQIARRYLQDKAQ